MNRPIIRSPYEHLEQQALDIVYYCQRIFTKEIKLILIINRKDYEFTFLDEYGKGKYSFLITQIEKDKIYKIILTNGLEYNVYIEDIFTPIFVTEFQ